MALTVIDIALITLIVFVLPIESLISVRLASRQMAEGPSRARTALNVWGCLVLWGLSAAILFLGIAGQDRDPAAFALQLPTGMRGLMAWAVAGMGVIPFLIMYRRTSRNRIARQEMRGAIENNGGLNPIIARSRSEFIQFLGVGFTAGVTEELIFRSYLLFLLSTIMPIWVAAILSLIAFILPHAYQGLGGMIQSCILGAFITGIVLLGGSIWPAVLLHIAIDWIGGLINWTLFRTEDQDAQLTSISATPAPV